MIEIGRRFGLLRKFFHGWGEVVKTWGFIFFVIPLAIVVILPIIVKILEVFLNYVEFGQTIFGFENGSLGVLIWGFLMPFVFLWIIVKLLQITLSLLIKIKKH